MSAFDAGIYSQMEKMAFEKEAINFSGIMSGARYMAQRAAPVISSMTHAASHAYTPSGALAAAGTKGLGHLGQAVRSTFNPLNKGGLAANRSFAANRRVSLLGRYMNTASRVAGPMVDAMT